MIKRLWIVLMVALLVALPLAAQDSANTVSFNEVAFAFPASLGRNVSIVQVPGDAPTQEQPGGPVPPHTLFSIYNNAPAPNNLFEAFNAPLSVVAIRTADLAEYPMYQAQLDALNNLVSNRPDLNTFEVPSMGRLEDAAVDLPYLPVMNASQVIRAQANYITTNAIRGVSYITAYRQDASPFTSGDFLYTLQGVSNDGSLYIIVSVPLTTPDFPTEISADFDYDTFVTGYEDYMAQTVQTLNQTSADAFTPSLAVLDGMFFTINVSGAISGGSDQPPATDATPIPTPTDVPSGSFGGLEVGSPWVMFAYGNTDDLQTPLEGARATLQFSATGVSGSAGCNSFAGSFSFDNTALSFGALVSTQALCSPEIMEQETAILMALQNAQSYFIDGTTLTINYPDGVLLLMTQ